MDVGSILQFLVAVSDDIDTCVPGAKKIFQIYGAGCNTAARLALLMMRTMQLENREALQLKIVQRHLYARILQDSDNRDQIQQTTKQEWMEDRLSNLNGRLDEFLQTHVYPGILEGRYPKTNLEADISKQWDDVWKVPSVKTISSKLRVFIVMVRWPSRLWILLQAWETCFKVTGCRIVVASP